MTEVINDLGQEISFPITDWQACEHPHGARVQGQMCRLEPACSELSEDIYGWLAAIVRMAFLGELWHPTFTWQLRMP